MNFIPNLSPHSKARILHDSNKKTIYTGSVKQQPPKWLEARLLVVPRGSYLGDPVMIQLARGSLRTKLNVRGEQRGRFLLFPRHCRHCSWNWCKSMWLSNTIVSVALDFSWSSQFKLRRTFQIVLELRVGCLVQNRVSHWRTLFISALDASRWEKRSAVASEVLKASMSKTRIY